ncbi:MAG: phage tail sheath C-terminal domain-containing protein [Nostoc sp.]|uniref:phage tail sheath family protein n=1 Tax=Nostoc sp. TaxID=1180 RepID=UPI002FF829E6
MPEYLTPGVYFEFQDAAPPVIRRIRTDIAGFVGLAERGPLNQAVQIDSWRHFQAKFGNFLPYSFLAYAVKGFFENGGRTCFIVRIAGVTATKASLVLKSSNNTDILRVTADNEGIWGNKIAIALTQVRPSKLSFSITVIRDRREREIFSNLSLNPDDQRYFVRLINQGDDRTARSQWVQVEDLLPPATIFTANLLPNAIQSKLTNQIGFLIDGQDGVTSLTPNDFIGTLDPLASDHQGLSVLDGVDAVGIVCLPDIHIRPVLVPDAPPVTEPSLDPCLPTSWELPAAKPKIFPTLEQPPLFSQAQIFTIQRVLVEHCERHQDRVAILDAVLRSGSEQSLNLVEILEWRSRFDSERGFAALYYPWVRVVDPLKLRGNPVRTIPPCGHIAGLYARSDFTVGVHKSPANGELFWAEDVTVAINDDQQAILNPEGINCVRAFPGRGIRVYGARTISSNPDWRYINVRRLMSMIEEAVDESSQWAVFEPHDLNLRRSLILSISGFLETIWRQGALAGSSPEEAFYIKCDDTNNPPEIVNQGKIITDIGVAPTHPAEFIVFRVGRTVEELEIVER